MRPAISTLSAALLVVLTSLLTWARMPRPRVAARTKPLSNPSAGTSAVGGTGQVERGRAKGSWSENSSWAWKLTNDSAGLEAQFKPGKYLKTLLLKPGAKPNIFTADAVLPDGTKRTFTGQENAKKVLVLAAEPSGGEGVKRISITLLHDTRLLVLLEGQDDEKRYTRLGEVAATREGISFAAGEAGPVCIVTEGRGTMQVSYKGKTYYVCCSGCKDLFNENPQAILAEAAEREKAKKK